MPLLAPVMRMTFPANFPMDAMFLMSKTRICLFRHMIWTFHFIQVLRIPRNRRKESPKPVRKSLLGNYGMLSMTGHSTGIGSRRSGSPAQPAKVGAKKSTRQAMESKLATIVDGSSNGSVPRLSLSLDNSVFLSSSLNVLSDLPEDKRKVLEHRLVNNPHAKNVETVVGFGENSRDKIYTLGTLLQNANSRDVPSTPIVNESSTDKNFAASSERSRDKSYIPGAPVIHEGSKDKAYIPGAPVTPVKPCLNAALAEAASRPGKDDIIKAINVSNRPAGSLNPEGQASERSSLSSRESDLLCTENMERNSHIVSALGILGGALDSEHFSTEELESSDEDSQGSASSKSNQGMSNFPSALYAHASNDDDGIHSVERKRKLFSGDDLGNGIIGNVGGKVDGRSHNSERAPKKGHKHQLKRSKTSSDVLSLDAHRVSERSPPKVPRTITHFFAPTGHQNPGSSTSDVSVQLPSTPTSCNSQQLVERDRDLARREQDLELKERALAEREREIARREAFQSKFEEDALQRAANIAREERAQAEGLRRLHDQRVADTMKGLLVARAREERALISARLCADTARVGRVGYIRSGISVAEVWEDGTAWADLIRRGEELEAEEGRLERDKKAFAKRCKSSNSGAASAANAGGVSGMPPPPIPSDEQAEQEEIYRLRMQKVRDKKKALQEDKEKLEREKYSLIREIKRVQDQNRSKYNSFPLLHKRYLLLHLLGKGGFSEVYRAFDLVEMQEVACKIHELNSQWSEEKKSNYMKHATRECEIQKKLCHQRIVRLIDVFEISTDGFCTVLEYCDGGDLEQVLKAQRTLPEREARSIIMQVFAGLRYLSDQKHRVIHYDLKPANILFHNGEVKISDFGLSKIMDDSEGGSMELTSQGAGTYWYLPPECFEVGQAPPKISSKVDVWSAGVIFFQMLFGSKPFGHGMSQEKMLIEQTITKSTCVHFPEGKDVPRVSDRAKEFMRRCLAYKQSDRPDVLAVFQDPYLRHTGRQASSAAT